MSEQLEVTSGESVLEYLSSIISKSSETNEQCEEGKEASSLLSEEFLRNLLAAGPRGDSENAYPSSEEVAEDASTKEDTQSHDNLQTQEHLKTQENFETQENLQDQESLQTQENSQTQEKLSENVQSNENLRAQENSPTQEKQSYIENAQPQQGNYTRPKLDTFSVFVLIFAVVVTFMSARQNGYDITSWFVSKLSGTTSSPYSDETGGWRVVSEAILEDYDPGTCTIERISVEDLLPERFESEFRFKKPVLVTFPNGSMSWTQPYNWTKEFLKETYGDLRVRFGQSLELTLSNGLGKHRSTFRQFLDEFMDKTQKTEPLHYVMDSTFFSKSSLSKTFHDMPEYFKFNKTDDVSVFTLGASLSGLIFHKESSVWNAVVFGRKRWFLYPITLTPPGGVDSGYTITEWVNNIYPTLGEEDQPIECVQEAGEILYIPENTYQAHLNLGDTVGVVTGKTSASTEVGQLFQKASRLRFLASEEEDVQKKRELNKKSFLEYESLHKLLPNNTEVMAWMGYHLCELHENNQSIAFSINAIRMDSWFVRAYFYLARSLNALGFINDTEVVLETVIELAPYLWEGYEEYGEFLFGLNRTREALPIFRRATKLKPDYENFWFYLFQCQFSVGDKQGADLSIKMLEELKEKEHRKKGTN